MSAKAPPAVHKDINTVKEHSGSTELNMLLARPTFNSHVCQIAFADISVQYHNSSSEDHDFRTHWPHKSGNVMTVCYYKPRNIGKFYTST